MSVMKTFIKVLLVLIGAVLLLLFALPFCMFGILNAGNGIGMGLSALMLAYGILFGRINRSVSKLWHKRSGKVILCTALILALVMVVFVIFATTKMVIAANNRPKYDTTVVVLGCQVRENGPSLMLRERLVAAQKFLQENPDAKCILSGGKGMDEPISEAECMYNWLVTRGIHQSRLYIEDKSTSTRENLIFSNAIIEKEGLNPRVTIITNDFHQYRASKIAKAQGIECYNVSGKTQWALLPTYYVRELGGILFEIFVGY